MTENDAEILALKILEWIARDEDAMVRFARLSGIDPIDLIVHASDPEMLGGMMDFFLSDEELIIAFCDETETDKELPALARQALPGGNTPHWT
ncbi:MAG: DUF3572 domain-containing protein [Parvibaculales bacterium]